jgi:hypothetical protein
MAALLVACKAVIYPYAKNGVPDIVAGCSMAEVVQRVMYVRKNLPPPVWGTTAYCIRCGRYNHVRASCFAKVSCTICRDSGVVKLFKAHKTHDTSKCLYQYYTMPERDYMPAIEQTGYGSREGTPHDENVMDFYFYN